MDSPAGGAVPMDFGRGAAPPAAPPSPGGGGGGGGFFVPPGGQSRAELEAELGGALGDFSGQMDDLRAQLERHGEWSRNRIRGGGAALNRTDKATPRI